MDQDMNSYLEQLRARTEKRLQNESNSTATASVNTETSSKTIVDEEVKPSSLSVDEIVQEADTLRYDLPNVSYDNESEKMMGDLMAWADREPTVPFEPVSSDTSSDINDNNDSTVDEVSFNSSENDYSTADNEPMEEDTPEPEKKTFSV